MTQINDIKIELTRAYERNDEDLQKSLNDALTSAKNTYIANTTAIQQQYGLVSIE
jgi:hypothetical protein